MKPFLVILLLCAGSALKAQLPLITNTFAGDTIVSTDYQVLRADTIGSKMKVKDNVVGVKIRSHRKDQYWLYFYFVPNDIPAAAVTISSKHFAYLKTAQGNYYRIPYSGKTYTYATNAKAGYFIDITRYVTQLKTEVITDIRLETSMLYHAIELKDTSQQTIARIAASLLSY